MAQKPEIRILDRSTYEKIITEHYAPVISLLEEATNYGTTLMTVAYERSEKKLADAVVLSVMLKQAVSLLDSISILTSKCAVTASYLPLRGLFESFVYIQWVLKENTEFRAAAYYYWDIRRQLSWARSAKAGTDEERKFRMDVSDAPWFRADLFDGLQSQVDQTIGNLEKKLTAPELKDVHTQFDRLRKTGKRVKDWYTLDGVENLRDMAKVIGSQAMYRVFYSHFSESTHGGSIARHMSFRKGEVLFEPVRNPIDWDQVVRNALTFIFQVYRCVIKKYCASEEAQFRNIYETEWRQRFLNIGKVTAKDGTYTFMFSMPSNS